MALTQCKECGHDVSTTAEACPNCGAPDFLSDDVKKEMEKRGQAEYERHRKERQKEWLKERIENSGKWSETRRPEADQRLQEDAQKVYQARQEEAERESRKGAKKQTTICNDCGAEVSKSATKCPNCGGATTLGSIQSCGCILFSIGVVLIVLTLFFLSC